MHLICVFYILYELNTHTHLFEHISRSLSQSMTNFNIQNYKHTQTYFIERSLRLLSVSWLRKSSVPTATKLNRHY